MRYGLELVLDMSDCNTAKFKRKHIKSYFLQLCELIDMQAEDLHFWDDFRVPEAEKQTDPKTKGTTAVQFILTSNITIHTLELLKNAYINVFSCKDFDTDIALKFSEEWFKGRLVNSQIIERI